MIASAAAAERFAADLDALVPPGSRLGIAVSGGPDSLALLVLAAAARPGLFHVATVDHGLRESSASEAAFVGELCRTLHVPHVVLVAEWPETPTKALQSRAREARYDLLSGWAKDQGLAAVLTAHHADDQAETMLMRMARAAGVSGLAGVRARSEWNGVTIARPLLGWRRGELRAITDAAGIAPIDDPTNRDPSHERTRARAFLSAQDWPDVGQVASSARHLADAEEALRFSTDTHVMERLHRDGQTWTVDAGDLPVEFRRRLLLRLFEEAGDKAPRGPDLDRAIASLEAGNRCTLGALMLTGGTVWRAEPVPPRRSAPTD